MALSWRFFCSIGSIGECAQLTRLSRSETACDRNRRQIVSADRSTCRRGLHYSLLVFAFTTSLTQAAFSYEQSRDLRDSCRTLFSTARQSEAQLETLKNQPLRMVRLGAELDVELYDRLAAVRRKRIASASLAVRTAQSALSGCLAKQLSVQQAQRVPASVVNQRIANRPMKSQTVKHTAPANEQAYLKQQPIRKSCDPETELYGCPIEEIRIGR